MKLDLDALFQDEAISCVKLEMGLDEGAGPPRLHHLPARAVIVTASSVLRCQDAMEARGRSAALRNLNLCDVVVAYTDLEGRRRCVVTSDAQDAGVLVHPTRTDPPIPFTGAHLLGALDALMGHLASGRNLEPDALRAMTAIDEVFDIVRASDDPGRFPDLLRGMAFKSAFMDDLRGLQMDISLEELGRFGLLNRIRSGIQAVDPEHPEAISSRASHKALLSTLGLAEIEGPGVYPAGHDPDLHGPDLSILTGTSEGRVAQSLARVAAPDRLAAMIDRHALSGRWVSLALKTEDGRIAGARFRESGSSVLVSKDGRDVLLSPTHDGRIVTQSWPTSERRLAISGHQVPQLALSSSEIPSRQDLDRLAALLANLRLEAIEDLPMERC